MSNTTMSTSVDEQFDEIVRVSYFGNPAVTPVPFTENMTVADSLSKAGIGSSLKQGESATVNGQRVSDLSSPVERNSVVVIMMNTSNG